ncbi:MAG: hypothetical protein K1W16_10445 [Lachnospiraceae bacterium]
MEGLNAYISPVDPSWRERLIPPEPEDLEELQMYLEMQKQNPKVPEAYLKFACYAAEGDGGLLSDVLLGEFCLARLPEITENANNDLLVNSLLIFWDEMGERYFIDLNNDNKISLEEGYYISSSFENLLFQCAVQKFEEKYFPEYVGFGYETLLSFDQKRVVDSALKEFIQKNQMQTVWFNDEYFLFAYNQEYSLWIQQYEFYEGGISVGGTFYGNDIDKIQRELLPQIGAVAD